MLEVGGGLAAAYATKLLVDLGASADVIASAGPRAPVFEHLHAGSRVVDTAPDLDDVAELRELHGRADITIDALPPGRWTEMTGPPASRSQAIGVVVHVSAFGHTGPRSGRRATGLTLQAMAGWPRRLAGPDGQPCAAGGNLDAYGAGVHAAVAALTAWRHATRTSSFVTADVSAFECLVGMLPYPTVHAEIFASAGLGVPPALRSLPGVVASADGWVGVNPLNQQGWNDLCEVMGLADFRDRLRDVLSDDLLAEEFRTRAEPWFAERDGDAIVELMQSMRVPSSRVYDGAGLIGHPQLQARGGARRGRRDSCRRSTLAVAVLAVTRRVARVQSRRSRGHHASCAQPSIREHVDMGGGRAGLPYSGLKVFDLTVYWAGPVVTMYLASLGADVVKVESHKRPDPFRYSTSSPRARGGLVGTQCGVAVDESRQAQLDARPFGR